LTALPDVRVRTTGQVTNRPPGEMVSS